MDKGTVTYREFLKREYTLRRRRNPGYSLRAFARDLELPAPKLSQALRGTCGFSSKRARQIAKKLNLSESEKDLFVALVESEHSRSKMGKHEARTRAELFISSQGFGELDLERFKIISDWYHFAILELTEVADFQTNPFWIAKRLGISSEQTKQAVQRLLDFGLLTENARNEIRQTQADLATPSGIPSRELREHHSQILQKADEALQNVPIERRDYSAMTMAINSSKINEAQKWIKEFRRRFCKDIQDHEIKDRVYCLAIQFFPLEREEVAQTKRKEKK